VAPAVGAAPAALPSPSAQIPLPGQPGNGLPLQQQQMLAYQQQLAAQQALFARQGMQQQGGGGGGGSASMRQAKSARPTRVYVGSIAYDVTEQQIRELFSIFGTIIEVEVPIDNQTGRHKGFSFIEYQTVDQAQRAIMETNGKLVWGRHLKVNRPGEPNTAPVMTSSGPPNPAIVNEALQALQQRMGGGAPPQQGGMFLPPAGGLSGVPGGLPGVGAAAQAPAARVYVGNLAYDLTAEHLKQLFSSFGEIKEVSVLVDRETNKPRGYAFVNFVSEQAAADAIASMNNFELCGRKLRVNSATPQGSGQSAMGGMAGGSGFNAQAVAHAQIAAALLQSAGVGAGLGGGGSGGLEGEGFLSSNAQRAALMEKLARGALPGSAGAPALESPVLLLLNMVNPGEVDGELEGEVREEASQYGPIAKVVVHENAAQGHVLIFVQFHAAADAAKARAALHARIFAGRVIRALPYPVAKFEAGVYTPEP